MANVCWPWRPTNIGRSTLGLSRPVADIIGKVAGARLRRRCAAAGAARTSVPTRTVRQWEPPRGRVCRRFVGSPSSLAWVARTCSGVGGATRVLGMPGTGRPGGRRSRVVEEQVRGVGGRRHRAPRVSPAVHQVTGRAARVTRSCVPLAKSCRAGRPRG